MANLLSDAEVNTAFQALLENESVKRALLFICEDHENTVAEQVVITEIPAPPFKEQRRAKDFQRRLQEVGLEEVQMDAEGNVYGIRRGNGHGPKLFVSAHLDTVFPEGTDTTVHEQDGILYAPGIGDDTRGLAELLAVVRALNKGEIKTNGDLIFGELSEKKGQGICAESKRFSLHIGILTDLFRLMAQAITTSLIWGREVSVIRLHIKGQADIVLAISGHRAQRMHSAVPLRRLPISKRQASQKRRSRWGKFPEERPLMPLPRRRA